MTTTQAAPLDLDIAHARIDRAHRMVGDIAAGTTRWKMTIPAREDTDSDLVLAVALADAERAVAELAAVRRGEAGFVGLLGAEVERCRASAAVYTADFTAGVEHAMKLAKWSVDTSAALAAIAPSVLVIYADDPDADGGDRDA